MTILTDDNRACMPLRNNIVSAMMWLVHDNQPGDLLFFHYSGHGSQVQDVSGDEDDGADETIVPLDYKSKGQIIDDDMHTLLVKSLKPGVKLIAIFDSCHSGTALDLPFVYKPSGGYMGQGPSKSQLMTDLFAAGKSLYKGDKKGAAKIMAKFVWDGVQTKFGSPQKQATNSSPADVVMISGCRDDQTSADATIGGQATGAMSFALMLELKRKQNPTLIELLNGMRDIMIEKKFTQIPQMSTSHEMDPSTPFTLSI
eukprot:TRINITY_DN22_c0_g2_i1.p1 TRINITY_DN22_c0_g2~~TRINITY_DN22_c0_g2_i1.p1  ORF type:complete len:294 (+),score=117.78 TRINITY_DN22_c0_g2_i1:116-883(+)